MRFELIDINQIIGRIPVRASPREKMNETVEIVAMRNSSKITDGMSHLSAFRLLMYSINDFIGKGKILHLLTCLLWIRAIFIDCSLIYVFNVQVKDEAYALAFP